MSLSTSIQTYDASMAIALIQADEDGPFTWTEWDQIFADALVSTRTTGPGPAFNHAERDWWTLLTLLTKLEWMKDCHREDDLDDGLWMSYAATEIDFFHVRFRSMLDHLADLLGRCATKPATVPHRFNDLKKFLKNPAKKPLFGPLSDEVLALIDDAQWADDVRDVRDDIVHRGADTLVFPDEAEILFQVHQRERRLVLLEGIMHNENVVDFRKYAALTLGLLMTWRERVAGLLRRGIYLDGDPPGPGWNRHSGLELLSDWSKLLLDPTAEKLP